MSLARPLDSPAVIAASRRKVSKMLPIEMPSPLKALVAGKLRLRLPAFAPPPDPVLTPAEELTWLVAAPRPVAAFPAAKVEIGVAVGRVPPTVPNVLGPPMETLSRLPWTKPN